MSGSGHGADAGHVAAFFRTDAFLVDTIASFVSEGLTAGERVLVLATLSHWNAVAARLEEQGITHGRAASDGRLILIDADHVLDAVTVEGRVSVDNLRSLLLPLVSVDHPMRVYGELVSLLAQRGDVDDALAIERLGEELASRLPVRILCGYHTGGPRALSANELVCIQDAHDLSWSEPAQDARHQAELPPGTARHAHAVQFYESREALAGMVGRFLGEGFASGLPAVLIATPEHRAAITRVLSQRFDVADLESRGELQVLDAAETLRRFMMDGMPEPGRFRRVITPLIERAGSSRDGRVVRAYGEMVDVLWQSGLFEAAVRLETLWNSLARTHAFSLLCGYSIGHFYKRADYRDVCGQHTHVVSAPDDVAALR